VNGNEAYMSGKACDTDFSRSAGNLREISTFAGFAQPAGSVSLLRSQEGWFAHH